MIFGFGKGRQAEEDDEDDEEAEEDFILFQGPANGNLPDLSAHAKLVQAGLLPAKRLVSESLEIRASMIRLDPKGKFYACTVYVDGVPAAPTKMPPQQGAAIIQMLKLLAGLDIKIKDKPQTGGVKGTFKEKNWDVRMSAQPAEDGAERLIIRFLDPALKLEKPKDLGFSEALVEKVRSLSASKKGLILAAGPPFSGVTTLRTALMRCTDAYVYSIYYLADTGGKDISHVKVFPALEGDELTQTMTRAKREDADVLVMDPITTAENATAMLQFAEDCAIVTETSAKDAADALVRLVHLAGNPQLVADNVKLVASQLLVRLLCKKCKRAYRPNPKLLGKIGLPPETKVLYRAHTASEPVEGEQDEEEETCDECQGTGYKGRFGLLEVIEMSDGMKEALLAGADGKTLRAKARAEKMQTYQSDGLRAVVSGNTSLEELQRSFKATS